MRTASLEKYPIYSGSYLLQASGGELPSRRAGILKRLLRSFLAIPGRIWRFFNLSIIIILILSPFCGYYLGWDEGFSDGIDIEYEEKVDWLLHEARI